MGSSKRFWAACALGLSLCAAGGSAQTLPSTPADALHAMAELAGVIFTGQVVAVRGAGAKGSPGVVEIDFAVEDAVRGVSGGIYTVREWAGLWPGGDAPFHVGQSYLMLLHAPGRGGLSSPVWGMDGAIPIRGEAPAVGPDAGGQDAAGTVQNDRITVNPMHTQVGAANAIAPPVAASANDGDARVVDLSWVGTRIMRPVTYAPPTRTGLARPLTASQTSARMTNTSTADGAASDAGANGTANYATVLGMLHGWETSDHGAR
jgi:hypothetical protein